MTLITRASVIGALGLALGGALLAPAAQAQSSTALSGSWQLSCTGRSGEARQVSLQIAQQGATLSGTFSAGHRSGQLSGRVRGSEVSLKLAGRYRTATLRGTVDGNTLQVHGAKGGSCTGTRS